MFFEERGFIIIYPRVPASAGMEASDSGLFHHLGKVAGSKGSREFKSHRFRKIYR